mmetsp:Transcript_11993/g.20024  ORF Transcript_11993/g.20024 Transcript_11993/m.20024 type:complete len:551 (+) Transcript_11993:138-1790(+)
MADFLNSTRHSSASLHWQVGLETDIGGGRENQDDCFVWAKKNAMVEHGASMTAAETEVATFSATSSSTRNESDRNPVLFCADLIVLCVLDGHGREVGRIASESAKTCLFRHLDDHYQDLISDPSKFLVHAHELAHDHIRNSFRAELERQGYCVTQTAEGYLMKRRSASEDWSCVHGGTSCSMAAIVDSELFIANVGDSTGIICASHPIFAGCSSTGSISTVTTATAATGMGTGAPVNEATAAVTHIPELQHILDAAQPSANNTLTSSSDIDKNGAPTSNTCSSNSNNSNSSDNDSKNYLVITAEHSPECPSEYERLRAFRSREGDPTQPALVVVYDASSHDKSRCNAVFSRDSATGQLLVTNQGSYYKNVRKEWASLVSTPPYARFQDALAFTRSLGDLHLHTYGVTHLPEIQKVNLNRIFTNLKNYQNAQNKDNDSDNNVNSVSRTTTTSNTTTSTPFADEVSGSTLCIVLATDGVWDNWAYEDVNRFVMDASCINAVGAAADGAKRVALSLMQRNALYAKRNFGSNADNATGIVLYLSQLPTFPSTGL